MIVPPQMSIIRVSKFEPPVYSLPHQILMYIFYMFEVILKVAYYCENKLSCNLFDVFSYVYCFHKHLYQNRNICWFRLIFVVGAWKLMAKVVLGEFDYVIVKIVQCS